MVKHEHLRLRRELRGARVAPLTYNARTAPSTAPPSDHKRDRGTFMADDGLSRLTDDEKTASIALLKRTIADYRYPLSPRITTLKGILAKLEPSKTASARYRRSRRMPRLAARRSSAGPEDDQMCSHGLQKAQRRSQGRRLDMVRIRPTAA